MFPVDTIELPMEQPGSWISTAIAVAGLLGTLVTAIATFALWRVTKLLARETQRMAQATSQPHVVATLSPNRWTMLHFDLHVANTGNATAYDIAVAFDPPLANGTARAEDAAIPLQNISVLKPGQALHSYLGEYAGLLGKTYQVEISWTLNALTKSRQTNRYTLRMTDHAGMTQLGEEPLVEIAKRIKKIEETWAPIAKGSRRTKVDVFNNLDRWDEAQQRGRRRQQFAAHPSAPEAADKDTSPTTNGAHGG